MINSDFFLKTGKLYVIIGSYDSNLTTKIKNDFPTFSYLGTVYYDDCGLSLKQEANSLQKGFCDLVPGEPFTIIENKDFYWYKILQTVEGYSEIGWIKIYPSNESFKKNDYSINVWGDHDEHY